MKKTLYLILIFFTLLLVTCQTNRGTPGEHLDIDVMSFNIRYGTAEDGENNWNNRKGLVYDVIRQYSPDIIGLQEALRFQIDEIKKNIPGYKEIGEAREGGEQGEYSAILYCTEQFSVNKSGTFWLSNTPHLPSRHWGNACIRICTWGRFIDKHSGSAFYVYNTHLDHESQSSREKSVRLIVKRIQHRKRANPFILTGDFNAGELNPAIKYLTTKGNRGNTSPIIMVDAFRALYPDEGKVGTFNGFQGVKRGKKIDYIFVASKTKVLSASIVRMEQEGTYPSDHFPVVAKVRFEVNLQTNKAHINTEPNKPLGSLDSMTCIKTILCDKSFSQ